MVRGCRNISLRLILLLSFFGGGRVCAQVPDCTFAYHDSEVLVRSNMVTRVMQDSRGFMWFCTWDGILRFDGYTFKNYKVISGTGVSHNRIISAAEDRYSCLWLSTYDDKLLRMNRRAERFESLDELLGIENRDVKTGRVLFSSTGDIFVDIINVGIAKISTDSNTLAVTAKLIPFPHTRPLTVLTEDYVGNIWFGTQEKLMCISDKGLTDANAGGVTSVCTLRKNICFGHTDGSVSLFDPKTKSLYKKINTGRKSAVTTLAATADGYLGIGFTDGFAVYNAAAGTLKNISSFDKNVKYVYADSYGLMWVAVEGVHGIYKIAPKTLAAKHFAQTVTVHKTLLTEHEALCIERNGRLWIGMESGGFGLYDRAGDKVDYFYNNPTERPAFSNVVADFCVTEGDVIWMIVHGRGVVKAVVKDKKVNRLQIAANPKAAEMLSSGVRGIMCDKDGDLWLGVRSGGVIRLDKNLKVKHIFTEDDNRNPIGFTYSITRDNSGNVWFGTLAGGVFKVVKSGERYSVVSFSKSEVPYSLNSNKVHSVLSRDDKTMWFGTFNGGVNVMDNGRIYSCDNNFKNYPKNGFLKVRSLAVDSSQNVWAGTTDGVMVMKYDRNSHDISSELHPIKSQADGSILSNDVVCIYRDSHNAMWVGTYGGGLNRHTGYDKSTGAALYKSYPDPAGKTARGVLSIIEDNNDNIWFTTENNICLLNRDMYTIALFSEHEGVEPDMTFTEGSAAKSPDGRLYFGTLDGCVVVSMEQGGRSMKIAVALTDFEIDDKPASPGTHSILSASETREVVVPNNNSIFAFRFAALNYSIQHRINYRYRLDGYDKDWRNDDGDMRAVYGKVPGGRYTFRVRAFDAEFPEQFSEYSVEVVVKSSVWTSTVAISIYFIVGLGALVWFGFFLFNRNRIYRNSLESRRIVKISAGQVAVKYEDDELFLSTVMKYIEENFQNPELKIEDIACVTASGRSTFYNRFKSLTDKSPVEFLCLFRLDKSRMYLLGTKLTISEIAFKTGFSSAAYFSSSFRKQYGMTPSEYRNNDKDKEP